ncbi:MAG: sugar phosphate isomerase/epimerase family protein [Anaerolineae bacterium]
MKLSCVTASYVADPLGYPGDIDWGLAARTLAEGPMLEQIDGMLRRLAPAKLDGLELWHPHAHPSKLTPTLAAAIRARMAEDSMVCPAYAGGVSDPAADPLGNEAAFLATQLLSAGLIAAHLPAAAIPGLVPYCTRHIIRVGFENGHEKDANEIMAAIGQGDSRWIGANLDTGNLAAQGGDPVRATRALGDRIIHVHFKDVPAVGSHDCVAIGAGIVDVAGVIRELKAVGYDGWLSIEVETGDRDPTNEIIASAETLRRLWD